MNRNEGYNILLGAINRLREARATLDSNAGCRIAKREYARSCSNYNGSRGIVRLGVTFDEWNWILSRLMISDNDISVPNWDTQPEPPRQPMYYTPDQEARLRQAEADAAFEAAEEQARRADEARYGRERYEMDRLTDTERS